MKVWTFVDSPVGRLVLVGVERPGGVVVLDSVSVGGVAPGGARHEPGALREVAEELRGYFAGEVREFGVEHTERGTEFQRRVWAEVERIPYGTSVTYGQLAERVGAPRDRVRAVAAAVGANPLLVVRPCHRVLGAGGSLTGYAGGVPAKRFLLVHEGVLQAELV
ncbi:MAG TPA: methylated-DNA--[protein]-cysteine S-methyltransferase [Actinophytocola sp.]|uniref:methylated-DNA--[protein]-cysteine S-methyltransferase n=1 Tax=Actinophytocola sp. TaxID=1872138 RepID=UPI002DDD7286|nr:methylated-DNA--[protein]-cysteine S-methyltransferase [Actinophytocola sp.]HEV2782310.1 methylated-DNA--[protein]-cysteine S-methyltransferase [Actinophytocola sp.]